jgi:ribosome maturation protein SDO1
MSKPGQQTILRYEGFELLCKPNSISLFRENKIGRDKVLIIDEIFKNSKKGDRPNSSELEAIFGTSQLDSCITTMLEKGDYQISAEERKKKIDDKRDEIKNYIFTNYTDENGLPIPMTKVDAVLEEMKIKIDGDIPTDKQLKPILKKLPEIMRIKKRRGVHAVFKIKHQHAGKCHPIITINSAILSERYVSQGVIIEVNLLPQQQDYLLETVANLTGGDYKFETLGEFE